MGQQGGMNAVNAFYTVHHKCNVMSIYLTWTLLRTMGSNLQFCLFSFEDRNNTWDIIQIHIEDKHTRDPLISNPNNQLLLLLLSINCL